MNILQIGKKISLSRKRLKLTQEQLSKMLGMSRATISEIENGKINEIGIKKIIILCEVLGLELSVTEKNSRPTLNDLMNEKDDD